MNFEDLFISEEEPYKGKSKRDKFLSRVFGIFNEEIIRIWCENDKSPLQDMGRPTIYDKDGKQYTLDFLFKDEENRLFVAEMKCEIEYQKYKFLTLQDQNQLKHHQNKRAFQLFLEIAEDPNRYDIKCNKELIKVNGTALIWGRTSTEGIHNIRNSFAISHIFSAESIIADLMRWNDQNYLDFIRQYDTWSSSLFSGLLE